METNNSMSVSAPTVESTPPERQPPRHGLASPPMTTAAALAARARARALDQLARQVDAEPAAALLDLAALEFHEIAGLALEEIRAELIAAPVKLDALADLADELRLTMALQRQAECHQRTAHKLRAAG